ncbi:PASTA domain-containing protein [Acidipila sp. EB88]|nr:penicillin-binding protein [Acidipila sp. EB88]RRA50133.1 PASTA domain-containing protein [Acidipila sp. EB88]
MQRVRVFAIAALFLSWALLIGLRLVWLQVVKNPEWVARAAQQQQRTFQVAPRRGVLYDRNLHELAMTVSVDSIYAVPGEIPADRRPALAEALSGVLHTDPQDRFTETAEILKRINSSRYFTWIARKQDPRVVEAVRALKLKGVYFQKEFKRFYPENDIAAQVLGYVGVDENGLGGVEQRFDKDLHGQPGHELTALDARRHVLDSVERDPAPGQNLVLTLDANIQFMAEQALDHAMERVKPLNGTVVVQDPHTGQILALAIRPTFNPNDVKHTSPQLLRDHAVSDVYEPGSTFKLVTYSAALDQHVTTPDQKIDCQGGKIVVAGRTVHDDQYNGVLTTSQALWESSDVAAIKLAERMGKDTFYSYIHAYGFGQRTGLELPGETRGLLKPPQRWQPTTIGSVPMGHEVAVTPIQLVTMASTIANGGTYLAPHIVLQATDKVRGNPGLQPAVFHPGTELPNPLPAEAHRVITTVTSAQMRKMMEGVVLYGTGKGMANLNGYSAAGKTGTAQKIDVRTHTYSRTAYVASFVGFAPVNDPAVTIAVIIDSPTVGGHFGRLVSAPVFQELAQEVLEYLGVPHDESLKTAPEMAKEKANSRPSAPEDLSGPVGDLNALFGDINDLPADDPLRKPAVLLSSAPAEDSAAAAAAAGTPADLRAGAPAPTQDRAEGTARQGRTPEAPAPVPPVDDSAAFAAAEEPKPDAHGTVRVAGGHTVAVPDLVGSTVRGATEKAGAIGLGVQVIGSGLARAQAPAPGTKVPDGTEIVVRFTRQ